MCSWDWRSAINTESINLGSEIIHSEEQYVQRPFWGRRWGRGGWEGDRRGFSRDTGGLIWGMAHYNRLVENTKPSFIFSHLLRVDKPLFAYRVGFTGTAAGLGLIRVVRHTNVLVLLLVHPLTNAIVLAVRACASSTCTDHQEA
jgi:hypothetical protein